MLVEEGKHNRKNLQFPISGSITTVLHFLFLSSSV